MIFVKVNINKSKFGVNMTGIKGNVFWGRSPRLDSNDYEGILRLYTNGTCYTIRFVDGEMVLPDNFIYQISRRDSIKMRAAFKNRNTEGVPITLR